MQSLETPIKIYSNTGSTNPGKLQKFYKPEHELSKLANQHFDRFTRYIAGFFITVQIDPPLSAERQIELFIRGINDIEIKKSIDEANPKTSDTAIGIARMKAYSKFKYHGINFYTAGFLNKLVPEKEPEVNVPVRERVLQPARTVQ
ncbi:hypothetical protein ACTA71_005863 [Dictyostelium dimigraforme]